MNPWGTPHIRIDALDISEKLHNRKKYRNTSEKLRLTVS